MANIFDGIKNISKEDLAHEVAILEILNSKNLAKITIQKAYKHLFASGSLAKWLGKKNSVSTDSDISCIPVLISDIEKELITLPMKYILKRYITIIIDRSEFSLKQTVKEALYENLSVKVINEAAVLFNIPSTFTPAMKADTIFIKYTDDIERLFNHNEKLTVYSKRLNREILAREVKILIKALNCTMTPKFKNMPSFINSSIVREEALNSYNDYYEKIKVLTNYKEELKGDEIILKKFRDHDTMIQVKFDKEREIIERYKLELEDLRRKKVQIELEKAFKGNEFSECLQQLKYGSSDDNNDILKDRKDRLKEDIVFLNANLNKIISEYNYKMNYIQEFKRKINNLTDDDMIYEGSKIESRYNDIKSEYDKLKLEVDGMYEYRKKQILSRWSMFFVNVSFSEKAISDILLLNPLNDLLYFERSITELMGYIDKTALSSGIKDDLYYIKTNFNGKEKDIYYKLKSQSANSFEIVKII